MSPPAIHVEQLTKRFADLTAVDSISFQVKPGSITALLGGNGAGKTTTISMLLGLLLPTSGQISISGINALRRREEVLPLINFSSPYVELPWRLTLYENLIVTAHLYDVQNAQERIRQIVSELNLTEALHRQVGGLSSGQKTRVGLAKALLNEPQVLLLDEPTASLDPDTADWIRNYLEGYRTRRGATILLASHNMREVEQLCDDVVMMRKGQIVDCGSPNTLIQRYGHKTMEEVFLDIARNHNRQPLHPS